MSDDFDELDGDDPSPLSIDQFRICYCGCGESSHRNGGRCRECGECDGFEFDEEATLEAFVKENDLPI